MMYEYDGAYLRACGLIIEECQDFLGCVQDIHLWFSVTEKPHTQTCIQCKTAGGSVIDLFGLLFVCLVSQLH
jgi:hypothetical protein